MDLGSVTPTRSQTLTCLYGKIGKASGVRSALNTASTSTQPSLVDPVDGEFKEPSKAPPQKQVWVPKPNELRNPLDTLPAAAAQVARRRGLLLPVQRQGLHLSRER